MPFFSPVSAGVGKATITSTTGSPTVDTSSRPGKTIYKFTGSGSITVGTAGSCEVMVIGGGGAATYKAGGGAGGMLYDTNGFLSAGTQTVTIGAGGVSDGGGPSLPNGRNGISSALGVYVAAGGGCAFWNGNNGEGNNGGSGGGANQSYQSGGSGTTGQGNAGGNSAGGADVGSGGGAGAAGTTAGNGGIGRQVSITGTATYYAGGGGGGFTKSGGLGGGGGSGVSGTANTGGGGGGTTGGSGDVGGSGGSGFVVIVIG